MEHLTGNEEEKKLDVMISLFWSLKSHENTYWLSQKENDVTRGTGSIYQNKMHSVSKLALSSFNSLMTHS